MTLPLLTDKRSFIQEEMIQDEGNGQAHAVVCEDEVAPRQHKKGLDYRRRTLIERAPKSTR